MTLEQRIDQFRLLIARNDEKAKVHPEEIKLAIGNAIAQLIQEAYRNKDTGVLDMFSKEYTSQTASLNSTTSRYEITLPAQLIFPPKHPEEAVITINEHANSYVEYAYIPERDFELMQRQDVFLIDSVKYYTLDNNKLIILTELTAGDITTVTSTGLRLRLVVAIDAYSYTDKLSIPEGRELDFMVMVFQFLGMKAPVELLNRNE